MGKVHLPHLNLEIDPPAGSVNIFNPTEIRQQIFDNTLRYLKNNYESKPLQLLDQYRVVLSNFKFGKAPDETPQIIEEALLNKQTISVSLTAKVKIINLKTGEEIYSGNKLIANVPYMLSDGSFVLNGTKYILVNQLRLKPGIYFRKKKNGNPEAVVHVVGDMAPVSHRYIFDPRTLKLTVEIGQMTMPITAWLKFLGASDEEIKYALGSELYQANYKSFSPATLWSRLKFRFGRFAQPGQTPEQTVQEILKNLNLNTEITKRVMGKPYTGVDKYTAFDIVSKLINLNKGIYQPPDRDDLAFKEVYGPEDLIAESFSLLPQTLAFHLRKYAFSKSKQPEKIIPAGVATKNIMDWFYGSGLGMNPDEVNPIEMYDIFSKVTIMGRGGINDPEIVTLEARSIQPSYFGFIDPIRTPEKNVGVDMRFVTGVVKKDRTLYKLFYNPKTKKYEWLTPLQTYDKVVGFPESLTLRSPLVPAFKNRRLTLVDKNEIDYVLPTMYDMFHPSINLLPLNNASFSQRLSMGAKMTMQALPLVNREVPLVQNAINSNQGWADYLGKFAGIIYAEDDGRVEKVIDNELVVRYRNGERKVYNLSKYLPSNRETYYMHYPQVKEGDAVKKGQLLASNNFTDNKGSLALGINLRTAYLPFRGYTVEDAFVISESAAKKLTSQHLHTFEHIPTADVSVGRIKFVSLFPTLYKKQQLDKLDENGVIKKGMKVEEGDPLILRYDNPEKSVFSFYHSRFKVKPTDKSIIWDYSYPGEVQEVIKDKKGNVRILIRAEAPAQVGDKLSGLYGDKGVISAVVPDDQMPRDEQGRPFELIETPFALFRRNPALLLAGWAGLVAEKTGKPIYIDPHPDKIQSLYDYIVNLTRQHNVKLVQDVTDPVLNKTLLGVSTGNRYIYKLKFTGESKATGRSFGGYNIEDVPVKGGEYGCLRDSTPILTNQGISPAIHVYSTPVPKLQLIGVSVEQNKLVSEVPRSRFSYVVPNNKTFLEIVTEDGQRVVVSKNHQLFKKGFVKVQASQLRAGSEIISVRILPSFYQWVALFVLIYLSPKKIISRKKNKVSLIFPEIKNTLLLEKLKKLLLPFAEFYVVSRKGKTYLEITLSPSWYFNKLLTNILDRICNGVYPGWNLILSGFFGLSLLLNLTGRKALGGNLLIFLPNDTIFTSKFRKKLQEILNVNLPSPNEKEKWKVFEENRHIVINVPGGLTNQLLNHTARYFSTQEICSSSIRHEIGEIYKTDILLNPGDICSFFVTPNSKLSKKEQNPFYFKLVKIVEINKLSNSESEFMYDFEVTCSNYISGDGILLSNSKRVSLLNTFGLLSHGATKVLRDFKLIKGQRNDVFWSNFILGLPTPQPQIPYVYDKYLAYLRGSGVNIIDSGGKQTLMPLADKDIDILVKDRFIESEKIAKLTKKDQYEPIKGGLFDPTLTGGLEGKLWSAIKLPFPVPNPLVATEIYKLLDLTEGQFKNIMHGEAGLDSNGNYINKKDFNKIYKVYTGPEGFAKFFRDNYNVSQKLKELETKCKTTDNPSRKSDLIRKLIFLNTLKQNNLEVSDLFWTKMPVVPPIFRPLAVLKIEGSPSFVANINLLYSDLIRAVKTYEELKNLVTDLKSEREAILKGIDTIVGFTDPISKRSIQKNARGLLKHVFKSAPKYSLMQEYLLATPVDVVGRSVIVPDPTLKLDEVALPEKVLWEVYRPFVIRRIVQRGISKPIAWKEFDEKSPTAKAALLEEMAFRPVVIDRAPLLHKFGMLAFWPKLAPGHVMRLNPLVLAGFNADFDGDTMNYHVPTIEDARVEAIEKMLPSKNVINPKDMKALPVPAKDFAGGIYLASNIQEDKRKQPKFYNSINEALNDLRLGKLSLDTPVVIRS